MGLFRRAEPAGYEDFVASRYREIVRFGALLAGDGRLGEDLAQEGLIAAYRSWPRLGAPDGRPEAYVRQVMVRTAMRARRRRWRGEVPTEELPDASGRWLRGSSRISACRSRQSAPVARRPAGGARAAVLGRRLRGRGGTDPRRCGGNGQEPHVPRPGGFARQRPVRRIRQGDPVNPTQASELLERAAASVTPSETDPATRMVSLGRRSVRRRRAWASRRPSPPPWLPCGSATRDRPPDGSDYAGPGTTVSFGGVSIAVPEGWRTSKVEMFNPAPPSRAPSTWPRSGTSDRADADSGPPRGQHARASPRPGVDGGRQGGASERTASPKQLVVKDTQPVQVDQPDEYRFPSIWTYRAFDARSRRRRSSSPGTRRIASSSSSA